MLNGHSMSIDEVVKELRTDLNKGLSVEVARSRLEKYGSNEFQKKERLVSPSHTLRNIILILFVITVVLAVFVPAPSLLEYLATWFL